MERADGGTGSRIGSKKRGKKAWTRSTVVSERGRPTTISHRPPSSPVPLASGFRCNHYVTQPLGRSWALHPPIASSLLSHTHTNTVLRASENESRYSSPPLSRRRCRSLLREGWFDYSCTTLTILFSSRFSFYRLVISYRNGPSIPPTLAGGNVSPLLAPSRAAPRYIFSNAG